MFVGEKIQKIGDLPSFGSHFHMRTCTYAHMVVLKHSNNNQLSNSSLVMLRRMPCPVNSHGGFPVGTWEKFQVNLMKNPVVTGSWMPKPTKVCLSKGSEVKIALPFANGLLCLARWILHYHVYICNNKLTPIGLNRDQDWAVHLQSQHNCFLWTFV